MMPGDMPCNRPCRARWCGYNLFGHCQDNWTCEDRINPDPPDADDADGTGDADDTNGDNDNGEED